MQEFVDKFNTFFILEKERGYDNRAVVGGLEKIISLLENEGSRNNIEP